MRVCCASVAVGNGNFSKQSRLVVGRVVADAETAADASGQDDVDATGEDAEMEGVVEARR